MSDINKMCPGGNPREAWTLLYGEEFPEEEEVAPVQPEQDRQTAKKPQRVNVSRPEKAINTGEYKSLTEKAPEETNVRTEGQEADKKDVSERDSQQSEVCAGQDRPDSGADEMEAAGTPPEASGDHTDSNSPDDGKDAIKSGNTPYGAGEGDREESAGDTADTGKDQPAAGYTGSQLNITDYPQYLPDSVAPAQHIPQYMIKGYLDALRDNLDRIYTLTESCEYGRAEEYIEAVRGTIQKIREMRRN